MGEGVAGQAGAEQPIERFGSDVGREELRGAFPGIEIEHARMIVEAKIVSSRLELVREADGPHQPGGG